MTIRRSASILLDASPGGASSAESSELIDGVNSGDPLPASRRGQPNAGRPRTLALWTSARAPG